MQKCTPCKQISPSANCKSLTVTSKEIIEEKDSEVKSAEVYRSISLYLAIPVFIRRQVFHMLDRSPIQMKKRAGGARWPGDDNKF